MDARETQKLLIKPVINHLNGDFRTVKGNFLIKYPIDDIITGFCFERSSDKNDFYLNTFSQPLYLLDKIICLSFGDRIKNTNGITSWNLIGSPRFSANTIEELISALQNNLSFVEEMRNPEFFYSYYEKKYGNSKNWRLIETLIYTAFWLKKPDAKLDAIDLIKYIETHDDLTIDWVKQCRDSLQELVNSADPIAILQKNKEQTIKNLKL
jgi:hypothetical protein